LFFLFQGDMMSALRSSLQSRRLQLEHGSDHGAVAAALAASSGSKRGGAHVSQHRTALEAHLHAQASEATRARRELCFSPPAASIRSTIPPTPSNNAAIASAARIDVEDGEWDE
jgi:hypothetical protein